MNEVLASDDCTVPAFPGFFLEGFLFDGVSGQTVTVNASSNDFDIAAGLGDPSYDIQVDPLQTLDAFDEDSGPGTDARFVHTLDETGSWTVGVRNSAPSIGSDPGFYTLRLDCTGNVGDPPVAPSNLTATPISQTEIWLEWTDNSDNEDDFQIQIASGGGAFGNLGFEPPDSNSGTAADLMPGSPYTFRVRARNDAGNSSWSREATATTFAPPVPCVGSDTVICLRNDRFQVEVDWRDFGDNTGPGSIVPFRSDDSGLIWFFNPDNWELLVKVLDGCAITDHFWVFAAATTNVEYTLRVTDTDTGVVKEYVNPLGQRSPAITDTSAFAQCP